ncbi:uncharacterized protein L3040_002686 [Drepanopeziza brunnea f. sp. 'multigermtubi']|uniref:Uncharacterized protein n=1 Tax=Marssonina brunnea f. sp. multigermtubi (strain MB_m1) TaxID=1072389 RepID=K1WP27_MARBU|nr:uncharacterized protein MBM_02672 [Drepanopeziza brunnea f. sp. 'multigermtubi' MB_m1]EKD19435.1 hypothetical protein MBM_02672 [Drepanopeziza brunnea f. sp. 'multigermtubi' MB_m1]KAJ5050817.1 hypothetical protein L3040_002686 [Drepanopeziza brunnea f. sp. 'multigermtubi']
MARAAEATESVRVERATAVAASVTKNATAEFKALDSRTAKEVVPAANDTTENHLNKTKRAADFAFNGFPKGAGDMVDTVKQHPEITAQKAPAVAVGVGPFVQSELIAGEVAILGKMAANSSKKTVTQISSNEGEKIFNANWKDFSNDAKAEVKNDKIQAAENAKGNGKEPAKSDATTVSAEIKAAEPTRVEGEFKRGNILSMGVQAPVCKSGEGSKQVKGEEATPVSLRIPIGADGDIKAVSKFVDETKAEEKSTVVFNNRTDGPIVPDTRTAPVAVKAAVSATTSKEVPQPVVQKAPEAAKKLPEFPGSAESQKPDVKSEKVGEKKTTKPIDLSAKSDSITAKIEKKETIIPPASVVKESDSDIPIFKEATTPAQVRKAVLSPATSQEEPKPKEASAASKPFKFEEKKIPDSEIESPKASNTNETIIDSNSNSRPEPAPIMPAKNSDQAQSVTSPISDEHVTDHIVSELLQSPSVMPQANFVEPETTQATSSASLASVTNTDKSITKTEALEQPAISDMTTISRESLDHLHSKIDALQEAVQLITKKLTTNLPPPTGEPTKQAIVELSSATDAVSEQVQKPSSSQESEVLAAEPAQANPSTGAEAASTETPAASAKKPGHAKRKSVIVTLGSYLWPFGTATPKGADAKASTAEGSPAGPSVEISKKDTTTSAPGAKDSAASLSDIPTPHIGAA